MKLSPKQRDALLTLLHQMIERYRLHEALLRPTRATASLMQLSESTREQLATRAQDIERLLDYMARDRGLDATSFALLWGWIHSELWIVRRRHDRDNLMKQGARLKLTRAMTREQLEAWACYNAVSSWLDVPMPAFLEMQRHFEPIYAYSPGGALLWLGVADHLASDAPFPITHSLNRWFSDSARDRLQAMAQESRPAREQLEHYLAHHPRPISEPAEFEPIHRALLTQLAELIRDTGPYEFPLPKRLKQEVRPDTTWEALVDQRPTSAPCGGSAPTRVMLSLEEPHFHISCACEHNPHRACPLKLSALRNFIDVLLGQDDTRGKLARELEQALRTPPWQRQIDHLLSSLDLDDEEGIPDQIDGEPCWLGWRVEGDRDQGLWVRPALVRHKKRGDGVVSKLLRVDEALLDALEPGPRRELLSRWHHIIELNGGHVSELEDEFIASLAGNPHLYYHDTTTRQISIAVHQVRLEALERGDQIVLQLMAEDAPLTPQEEHWLREQLPYDAYPMARFDVAREPGRIVFWKTSRKLARFLERSEPSRLVFPKKASGYLLEKLSQREHLQGEVALSEGLRGERVAPRAALVMRLSFKGGVLWMSLRSQPIEGGPTHPPGDGPATLYAMQSSAQGTRTLYTERDLHGELARAREVIARLELEYAAGDAMSWETADPQEGLDLIEQIRQLASDDPLLALEWDSKPPQLKGSAVSSQLHLKLNLKQRLFEVGGQLEIDGEVIPIMQLLEAASERRRWVALSEDQFVRLDESLQQSLARIAALTLSDADANTKSRAPSLSPLAAPALLELTTSGVQIEGPPKWLEMVDRIEEARHLAFSPPPALHAELRSYQQEGMVWMLRLAHWAPGACLADDMGLGKTVQALAMMLHRASTGPALVVAPTSVCFNWEREAAKFAPSLEVVRIRSGEEAEQLLAHVKKRRKKGVLCITSYDLVARNINQFEKIKWHTLALDEAQAIKNSATQRAQAVQQLEADFKLALTGTPVENNTGELWSLFNVLVPGLLGSHASFRRRYQVPIERDQDQRVRGALATLVSPFILRRVKREVARDLPERTDIRVDVELSRGEQKVYEELRRALLAKISGTSDGGVEENQRFQILAAITRLRQAACHPALLDPGSSLPSAKLQVLSEHLEEVVDEGYKALVFSQFTSLLSLVREHLEAQEYRVAYLDGSLPAKKRQEVVEAFQRGEYDVFLLSIKAGGVGLNLTAASSVFLLDPWWNPAVEDQATDRAHRIGQQEPVTVYRLVAMGTIEEAIYELHEEKRALFDAVLSEASARSSRALSPDELRALLAG